MIDFFTKPLETNRGEPVALYKTKSIASDRVNVTPVDQPIPWLEDRGYWTPGQAMNFKLVDGEWVHVRWPELKLRNVAEFDINKPLELSDGTPVVYVMDGNGGKDYVVTPETQWISPTPYTYRRGSNIAFNKRTLKHCMTDTYLRNRTMSSSNNKFEVGGEYATSKTGWNAKILAEVRKPGGTVYFVGFIQNGPIGSDNLIVPMLWNAPGGSYSSPNPNGYEVSLKLPKVPGQEAFENLLASSREAVKQVVKSVRLTTPAVNAVKGITGLGPTEARQVYDYVKTLG